MSKIVFLLAVTLRSNISASCDENVDVSGPLPAAGTTEQLGATEGRLRDKLTEIIKGTSRVTETNISIGNWRNE